MRFSFGLLVALAAVGVAVTAGTLVAQAGEQTHAAPSTAADQQSALVEDFGYPGADAIQASDGVVLISGDGHIRYVGCATPPSGNIGLIRVHTTDGLGANHDGMLCFQVSGSTGHIAMKVPGVFEIRGDGLAPNTGHRTTADLTTDDGTRTTVNVNPSGSTPVGVGANPNNAPTTLLALDVTG